MQKNNDLLGQVTSNLQATSTSTPIEAGQKGFEGILSDAHKQSVFKVIDQVFHQFELVYHNQYIKAFPTLEKLQDAKKLWYSHLYHYQPEHILQAAREAVQQSEYLPSIRGLTKYIENVADCFGLPDVRSAYLEACHAPSPKAAYAWRHLAVYHAGKQTGWYFLANNAEQKTFPVFQKHYQTFCQQVRQGFKLEEPKIEALPDSIGESLSKEEKLEKIKNLQKGLK